jgi:hypothetical protein
MKRQFSLPLLSLILIVLLISCNNMNPDSLSNEIENGVWVGGDFHQHTTYSGGDYSIGYVMEASNKYGLDWWSNSDHGGTREFWGRASGDDLGTRVPWTCAGIKPLGSPPEAENIGFMWRWQTLKATVNRC